MRVGSRVAAVIGAALALAGGGAAALALTGCDASDPARSGNRLPLDDNHPSSSTPPAAAPTVSSPGAPGQVSGGSDG